jgi:raffinose/stachyose/melibiose transport system permease protein
MKPRSVPLASPAAVMSILMMAPALLMLAVFRYSPVLSAVWHSFFAWDGFTAGRWVGLGNYRELLADPVMGTASLNVGIYILIRVALNVAFPLLAAELIFHLGPGRGQSLYKSLFCVPLVVPTMVVLLVWKFVYDGNSGILNALLRGLGLGGAARDWLGDFTTAIYSVAAIGFPWVTGIGIAGFGLLLYLAGLQGIPGELFDASAMDGARPLRRFLSLELPFLARPLWLIALLTVINTLQGYVPVMTLTQGGPGISSMVPGLYLYKNAFGYDRFGYACSIGVAMAVVLVALALAYAKIQARSEEAQ